MSDLYFPKYYKVSSIFWQLTAWNGKASGVCSHRQQWAHHHHTPHTHLHLRSYHAHHNTACVTEPSEWKIWKEIKQNIINNSVKIYVSLSENITVMAKFSASLCYFSKWKNSQQTVCYESHTVKSYKEPIQSTLYTTCTILVKMHTCRSK